MLLIICSLPKLSEHFLRRPESLRVRHGNLLQESRHFLNSDPIETLLLGELLHRLDESFFEVMQIIINSTRSARADFFFFEVDVGNDSDPSESVPDRDVYFPEFDLGWHFLALDLVLEVLDHFNPVCSKSTFSFRR